VSARITPLFRRRRIASKGGEKSQVGPGRENERIESRRSYPDVRISKTDLEKRAVGSGRYHAMGECLDRPGANDRIAVPRVSEERQIR